MRASDVARHSLAALKARRLRTILTVLGIVVGTAPIVALVAAVEGQSAAIEEQLGVLGPNTMVVRGTGTTILTAADVATIEAIPGVALAVPTITGSGIAFQSDPATGNVTSLVNVTVLGIDYARLASVLPAFRLANGTLDGPTLVGASVAAPAGGIEGLGGAGAALPLPASLGGGGPLGGGGFRGDTSGFQRPGGGRVPGGGDATGPGGAGGFNFGTRFTTARSYQQTTMVGGVAAAYGASALVDLDNTVVLPLADAARFLNITAGYNQVVVVADSADEVAGVQSAIQAAFPTAPGTLQGRGGQQQTASRVTVFSATQAIQSVQGVYAQVAVLLGSVAAIGVVVAGIGIANTMFVSVLERTTEVGILKSIGFTRRAVLGAFLLEAVLAGFVGGILGILAGVGLSYGLGGILNPQALLQRTPGGNAAASAAIAADPVFSPSLILAVLGLSVLVAALAGILPARRAATLDPVVALRRL